MQVRQPFNRLGLRSRHDLQISHKSRASSELSMDGREVCILHPGEYITLRKSAFPIPCIVPKDGQDGWVADIK
jgi:NADH kinase